MSNSDCISLREAIDALAPSTRSTAEHNGNASAGDMVTADAFEQLKGTSHHMEGHQQQVDKQAQAYLRLSVAFYQDSLGQSKQSFRFAWIAASVGLALFLSGIIMLFKLSGTATSDTVKAYAAIVPMVGGAIAGLVSGTCLYIYGIATSQLSAFHSRLDRLQRYFMAESFCSCITANGDDLASKTMAKLVNTMAKATIADTQMYVQPLQPAGNNSQNNNNDNNNNNNGSNNNSNNNGNNDGGNNNGNNKAKQPTTPTGATTPTGSNNGKGQGAEPSPVPPPPPTS